MEKRVLGTRPSPNGHWVGDGFPVRSLFSYDDMGRHLNPFLLLDYAGPARFAPAARPRGVGEHPHRGFETVTIVYAGEVAHRDSTGQGGLIGPGDVQWMTAASGILHEEFHSPEFTRRGGELEMAQLWVNLPASAKRAPPGYQTLTRADIPDVELPAGVGRLRVIAGDYVGQRGPARTFTPINVWDVRLNAHGSAVLPIPEGHLGALALLRGSVSLGAAAALQAVQVAVLDAPGDQLTLNAGAEGATFLLLSAEPLNEPIVGYGPFVMNTRQEIETAIRDFQAGKFGKMAEA